MDPSTPDALFDSAVAHHRANRLDQAQAVCRRIIALDAGHADALHLLGIVTRQLRQDDDQAISLVQQAITLNPRVPEYHCNLGLIYSELQRWPEAIAAFERALELRTPYASVSNHLGNALRNVGRLEEAEGSYRRAVSAKADFVVAWNNLGNVLRDLDRLEESAASCRTAIALQPGFAAAHNNLANALNKLGRTREAIAEYRHAIALEPDYAHAHYNLALTLLQAGEFREGWSEHEWRVKLPEPLVAPFPLRAPHWDGSDLHDRSIVIHGEQGFGDTIQFLRYVPEVIRRGGRVTLVVRPELARLLQGANSQGAEVLARGTIGPRAFDEQLHLMSLPWILGIDPPLAMPTPYLRAPRLNETWDVARRMREIADSAGPKSAWSGQEVPGTPGTASDHYRLRPLAPLQSVKASFFSLQCGVPAKEAASSPLPLIDWTADFTDFADTAELIAALDLVITVDTAVAHLAGAMGKKTWVLLPFVPDWRWMLDRPDSPWYPTMRLFRQRTAGDWDQPVAEIAAALTVDGEP